jgi:pimeloyl-ACP methyl ester carboxylesterase
MKSLHLAEWETSIGYHEIPGNGKTLVYLPGLCMPADEQFRSVVTHTDMAGYHTLLIDFIGSGCSDHSERFDYTIENHARSVAAVLDFEGVKSCMLIGHSMGGTVGIMLALLRPDLVSNLIIAEANISSGGGETTRRIVSYSEVEYVDQAHQLFLEEMRNAECDGNAITAFLNEAWSKADPVGLYRSSVALVELEATFKKQLQKLSIPCTFIYGEYTFPKEPNEVKADAPDPEELKGSGIYIAIVQIVGHAMMFDNLNGFVDVLKGAIQS